jgi:hypothetical protein
MGLRCSFPALTIRHPALRPKQTTNDQLILHTPQTKNRIQHLPTTTTLAQRPSVGAWRCLLVFVEAELFSDTSKELHASKECNMNRVSVGR